MKAGKAAGLPSFFMGKRVLETCFAGLSVGALGFAKTGGGEAERFFEELAKIA